MQNVFKVQPDPGAVRDTDGVVKSMTITLVNAARWIAGIPVVRVAPVVLNDADGTSQIEPYDDSASGTEIVGIAAKGLFEIQQNGTSEVPDSVLSGVAPVLTGGEIFVFVKDTAVVIGGAVSYDPAVKAFTDAGDAAVGVVPVAGAVFIGAKTPYSGIVPDHDFTALVNFGHIAR